MEEISYIQKTSKPRHESKSNRREKEVEDNNDLPWYLRDSQEYLQPAFVPSSKTEENDDHNDYIVRDDGLGNSNGNSNGGQDGSRDNLAQGRLNDGGWTGTEKEMEPSIQSHISQKEDGSIGLHDTCAVSNHCQPKHNRNPKRKRSRYDFDKKLGFAPFQGSVEDLIHKYKHEDLDGNEHDKQHEAARNRYHNLFGKILTCVTGISKLPDVKEIYICFVSCALIALLCLKRKSWMKSCKRRRNRIFGIIVRTFNSGRDRPGFDARSVANLQNNANNFQDLDEEDHAPSSSAKKTVSTDDDNDSKVQQSTNGNTDNDIIIANETNGSISGNGKDNISAVAGATAAASVKTSLTVTQQNNNAPSANEEIAQFSMSSTKTFINQNISNQIVAVAEAISQNGILLDRQDSMRIAAQEVLAAQRQDREEKRRLNREKSERLKKDVDDAFSDFYKFIMSITIGPNMIACIVLGCASRFIFCYHNFFIPIWRNEEADVYGDEQMNPSGIVYSWFVRDICGCLETPCRAKFGSSNIKENEKLFATASIASATSADTDFSTTLIATYFHQYVLYYAGISALLSSSTTVFLARCALRCIIRIMLVGFTHRIIRIFHSNFLHQAFNLIIMALICIRTALGRSVLRLILEIFTFNCVCGGMAYYGMMRMKTDVSRGPFLKNVDFTIPSNKTTMYAKYCNGADALNLIESCEGHQRECHRMISAAWETKRKLFLVSILGALVLGLIQPASVILYEIPL